MQTRERTTEEQEWENKVVVTPKVTQSWFGSNLFTSKGKKYRVSRATKQCRGDNFRLLLYPVDSIDPEDCIIVLSSQVERVEG